MLRALVWAPTLLVLAISLPACKSSNNAKAPAKAQPASPAADPKAVHGQNHAAMPPGHPPTQKAKPSGLRLPPPRPGQGAIFGPDGVFSVGSVQAKVDKSWIKETPSNGMRKAQFKLEGKAGAGSFVVFQFPGGAGAAKQNLDRWIGQFGPEAAKTAKTSTQKRDGLTIHALDVQGNYQARAMPGQDPKSIPSGSQRMLAAVIEGPEDPLYFKILGPVETLKAHDAAWKALLASLKVKAAQKPAKH